MNKIILILFLSFTHLALTQNDSLPYRMYKNKVHFYSSLGYNAAPFSIKGDFGQVDRLKYRANLNPIMGLGFAYKWIAFNINFKLPGYARNATAYGKTNYLDLGVKFGIKRWFFKIDLHTYRGFGIKNANSISEDLTLSNENVLLNNQLNSFSFSMNGYRFDDEKFKIKPAMGIVGRYLKEASSFYMKYTLNLHGIDAANKIMPHAFFEKDKTIHRANNISAFDFGLVPGWAHVNNIDGWQYGLLAGLGGVVQIKAYSSEGINRSFLGLAPRLDLKLQGGYNVDNWFLMLTSSFDNKSIRFNEFRYQQVYYYVRLTYGYRF